MQFDASLSTRLDQHEEHVYTSLAPGESPLIEHLDHLLNLSFKFEEKQPRKSIVR